MSLKYLVGWIACAVMMLSCYFNWTWYPDIQQHFTGFYSEGNYYGKPGILLNIVALVGMLTYGLRKGFLFKINAIVGGIGMAYAIKSFLLFTSAYDGYLPIKQPAIYFMLIASIVQMVVGFISMQTYRGAEGATKESS